jgi:hypothetical protein
LGIRREVVIGVIVVEQKKSEEIEEKHPSQDTGMTNQGLFI